MGTGVILSYRDVLVSIFEHRPSVVVHVEVVGCRKDSNDRREFLCRCFPVHGVSVGRKIPGSTHALKVMCRMCILPSILSFMPSDYAK